MEMTNLFLHPTLDELLVLDQFRNKQFPLALLLLGSFFPCALYSPSRLSRENKRLWEESRWAYPSASHGPLQLSGAEIETDRQTERSRPFRCVCETAGDAYLVRRSGRVAVVREEGRAFVPTSSMFYSQRSDLLRGKPHFCQEADLCLDLRLPLCGLGRCTVFVVKQLFLLYNALPCDNLSPCCRHIYR